MIDFILTHWNAIAAIALIAGVLVYCARHGVNTNVGEFPTHRR